MKQKQVLEFIFYIVGVFGFLLGVGALNTLAEVDTTTFFVVGVIVGTLLILVWLLLVLRDNARERRRSETPQFFVKTPTGLMPLDQATENRRQAELYDQEEDE